TRLSKVATHSLKNATQTGQTTRTISNGRPRSTRYRNTIRGDRSRRHPSTGNYRSTAWASGRCRRHSDLRFNGNAETNTVDGVGAERFGERHRRTHWRTRPVAVSGGHPIRGGP